MNNLVVAVARETQIFVGIEAVPGQLVDPINCSMVVASGAGTVQQAIRQIDDPQYRNTLSALDPIIGSFDVGKWSFPALIKTVGIPGVPPEPELGPVYQALFGNPSVTDQTAWFGSNTRAYLLKKVQCGGTIYPSLTLWFKIGHMMYFVAGATCNSGEFNVVGNDLCRCNFSGEFMRHGFAGTDIVATGDAGSTTLQVEDARKFFLSDPSDFFHVCFCDPVTGVKGASAKVVGIDYAANTLTLAATATRAVGNLVAPCLPTGEEKGTPLYGKYGLVRYEGVPSTKVAAELPTKPYVIQSARVTVTNNLRYHADLKDNQLYPSEYVAPARRTVEGELSVFMYRDLPVFMYKALRDPLYQDYVIIPMQDRLATPGRIAEIHCPRVTWGSPNIAGEDEKTATIPFKSTASPSYDDEAALVFAEAPSSATDPFPTMAEAEKQRMAKLSPENIPPAAGGATNGGSKKTRASVEA